MGTLQSHDDRSVTAVNIYLASLPDRLSFANHHDGEVRRKAVHIRTVNVRNPEMVTEI
jgi:hypothetical protein